MPLALRFAVQRGMPLRFNEACRDITVTIVVMVLRVDFLKDLDR